MENILIRTEKLTYMEKLRYPDLLIRRGSVCFITGPSGAGKSTLLKLLNATVPPGGGSVFYKGKNLADWDTISLRKEVLLVAQSVFLFDTSIRENFREFYQYRGLEPPGEERIREYLRRCLVPFEPDREVTTMSGGEKQRVYLAVYLSFQPEVLMLDEPTSALDASNGRGLFERLTGFCREQGITMLAVSHDRELTRSFAETVISLEE